MSNWLSRFDARYRFVRVDRITGKEVEQFRTIKTGGTIERNLNTEIKESGELEVVGRFFIGADFLRVYLDATFADESTETVCLGTFLAVSTSRTADGSTSTSKVNLYGRLKELADAEVVQPFSIPAGTNLVNYAIQMITDAGLEVIAEKSDYTNSQPLYYGVQSGEEKTSADGDKLKIVNDLLKRAGFNSCVCDAYGRVVLSKSVSIPDRPIKWTFEEGANARFLREVEEERDTSQIANVVYTVYQKDKNTVIGMAQDTDPMSPYSIQNVGREISAKYSYQDEATQQQAQKKAEELLAQARSILTKETISHIYAPITLGDAVNLIYRSAGITGKFAVRTQRFTLKAGCLCESEVRAYGR